MAARSNRQIQMESKKNDPWEQSSHPHTKKKKKKKKKIEKKKKKSKKKKTKQKYKKKKKQLKCQVSANKASSVALMKILNFRNGLNNQKGPEIINLKSI